MTGGLGYTWAPAPHVDGDPYWESARSRRRGPFPGDLRPWKGNCAIADHGAPGRIRTDLAQLFRRAAFNVLTSHSDDHLRNHGFLRTGEGWRLAPAFDLNPVPGKPEHELSLDGAIHRGDLEVLRVMAGVPRQGADFDAARLPMEAALVATAVSFDKGCYLGQEVVLRGTFRGQIQKGLVQLALPEGAGPGTPLATIFGSVAPKKPSGIVLYSYRRPTFRVRFRLILKSS